MMQRIRYLWKHMPGIRGIYNRLAQLEEQYAKLQKEKEWLDFRIDDVYHELFLNRKEGFARYARLLPQEAYPDALCAWYFAETGKKLDLEHPAAFNEKLQWIKLYGLEKQCTQLADKYAVRTYIEKMLGGGYLVPLLGVWDTFDEIDFDNLPDQFVLKANHGSGMNVVVNSKAAFDRQEARKRFCRWMDTDYAFYQGFELQYKGIPRKILAVGYLGGIEDWLEEYEVYCFNGSPEYIHYITDRNGTAKKAVFDIHWERMPFTTGHFTQAGHVRKPRQLEKIVEMSRILSKDFLFVRVDWFVPGDGSIRFAEMTFTPASGLVLWDPPEYDRVVGQKLRLPVDPC